MVDYNGKLHNFRGYALVFIGDTPASALAGGFKEGVGGAHRGCRTCMITSDQLDQKVCVYLTYVYMYVCPLWVISYIQLDDSELTLRTLDQHYIHCSLVESTDDGQQFSKEYGVNRRSELSNLPQFDLCRCLPHDVMHVLLEGILPLNCRLLLAHCILKEKYFTLNQLNTALLNFPYGQSERSNAPGPIDRERLSGDKGKLVQSG